MREGGGGGGIREAASFTTGGCSTLGFAIIAVDVGVEDGITDELVI
jgi:hypothetical protein